MTQPAHEILQSVVYCVTPPSVEPISVADAKIHLRVDAGDTSQDSLIARAIAAARQWAENFTERVLISQTWVLALDTFPYGWPGRASYLSRSPIELPKPPLQQVVSVQYIDVNQNLQTWSPSLYTVTGARSKPVPDPRPPRGRIVPVYGQFFPPTLSVPEAVTVTFTCGYGDAGSAVPPQLIDAMLVKIGDMFQRREPTVESRFVDTKADEALASSFRSIRFD